MKQLSTKTKYSLLFLNIIALIFLTGCGGKDYAKYLMNYNGTIIETENALSNYYQVLLNVDDDLYFEKKRLSGLEKIELQENNKYKQDDELTGFDEAIQTRLNTIKALKLYASYLLLISTDDLKGFSENDIQNMVNSIDASAKGKKSVSKYLSYASRDNELEKMLIKRGLSRRREKLIKLYVNSSKNLISKYLTDLETDLNERSQKYMEKGFSHYLNENVNYYNRKLLEPSILYNGTYNKIDLNRDMEIQHIKDLYKEYHYLKSINPVSLVQKLEIVNKELVNYVNSDKKEPFNLLNALADLRITLEAINSVIP